MNASLTNESFLLAQFRDFYSEVIRLKRLIENSGGMHTPEIAPPEEPDAGAVFDANITAKVPAFDKAMLQTFSGAQQITSLAVRDIDDALEPTSEQSKLALLVRQNLIALFRRNAVQILRVAGKPTDNYFEAQYVMAAFADDVFIHLNWEGKRAWTSNLLETALFRTHLAGEKFFEKLDQLLRDRDPADRSLAAVYLTALALGFRGRYHGLNDHGKIRRYRKELFSFAFRRPADLVGTAKVGFPDSYGHNLRNEKRKKLTNPRVWLGVLAVVLVTYLVASHALWMRLTSRIEQSNQQIVEVEKRLDALPPPQ